VSVIGVPLNHGQPIRGVEEGPAVIRDAGLFQKLKLDGWDVKDRGDLTFPVIECSDDEVAANMKFARMVGRANQELYKEVAKHSQNNELCLSLGGDHSLGIGSIAGVLSHRPDTGVIWVDAHADLNTPKTSLSGNIHGMSVSFLMGLDNTKQVPGFEWLQSVPDLNPNSVVYIGLRDLDAGEKRFIRSLGIKAFTMMDVDRLGIGQVMERAVDHLCLRRQRPIHLSFDIDSVDPAFAPSTGTRVQGGLSYREAYYIAESIAETGLLGSLDMVEVNPSLSPEGVKTTVDMAVGLICSALGNRIL